jgi:hypothetical protein
VYVVICDNPEGEPDILGPFVSDVQAQAYIDRINTPAVEGVCPNDHYALEMHIAITEGLPA